MEREGGSLPEKVGIELTCAACPSRSLTRACRHPSRLSPNQHSSKPPRTPLRHELQDMCGEDIVFHWILDMSGVSKKKESGQQDGVHHARCNLKPATQTRTHTQIHIHIQIYTYTDTYTDTHTQTHIHIHRHIHRHIHTQAAPPFLFGRFSNARGIGCAWASKIHFKISQFLP